MTTTEAPSGVTDETHTLLATLGVSRDLVAGGALEVRSPITGEVIARVKKPPPGRSGISRNVRRSRRTLR